MCLALPTAHAAHVGAETWRLCPAEAPLAPLPGSDDPRPRLSADRVVSAGDAWTLIEGNALLEEPGRRVSAQRITLDRDAGRGSATGEVTYQHGEYVVYGETAQFDLDADRARLAQARYQHPESHMQGRAARIERLDRGRTRLRGATVSSCPAQKQDWVLQGDAVLLDHEARQGTARDAVLRFKGVPIFYSPWFRFPLGEERLSGFLAPSIGVSSSTGTDLSLPWYWNIAPQADATFTPRLMSERGAQLATELRYLQRAGQWQLDTEYLDDRKFGAERSFARLRHNGQPASRWVSVIDAAAASDKNYFDDLGNSLDTTSITHLEQRAEAYYYADSATLQARLQSYQTLDDTIPFSSRPYQRLPQLTWTTHWLPRGEVDYSLNGEAVHFERRDSITGERLDLRPRASHTLGGAAWFLRSSASLRHTRYALTNTAPASAERLERTLPVLSLDSGLFFERRAGTQLQTLEPRLFYLYVPYEDQNALPNFDSSEYTFSFAQLFRENRFTGVDRVGDANQLSLALSTRLLAPDTGVETFSASIGQIAYFRDREVTLPGGVAQTRPTSDAIVEASAALGPLWTVRGALQYNPQTRREDKRTLQLAYRDRRRQILNFAYRDRRDLQETVDVSARWQLTSRWSVVGRWNRSLRDAQDLEQLAGLEYESCCWALRAVAREFLRDDGLQIERSVYLQLVLKGLAGIGEDAGSLLERGILGYRDPLD